MRKEFKVVLSTVLALALWVGFAHSNAAGGQNRLASDDITFVYQLCNYIDADSITVLQEVGGTNVVAKVDCSQIDGGAPVNGETEDENSEDE